MYSLKRQLARIPDPDPERDWDWPVELDASYEHVLRAALPLYREHFWQAHDASNRAWIASAVKALERYESALVERMLTAYGGEWIDKPVRVDVCAYANWAGAYTTDEPTHITLSSTDPEAQGHSALEVLMHEASHSTEMFSALGAELTAAFEARGAQTPSGLWHLFIFVSAGGAV